MYGNELIDTIAPFQDPYSEVSLFLSRKIKEQINSIDHSKGWTLNLQERLLEKITPEFGKKFPHCRLGAATLKKTWEKVSHLFQLFKEQNDALTAEGKINLDFLIRENLKTVLAYRKNSSFHPFLLAQQLALKVGESIATYEGIRPQLERLTELIWTALCHLVPSALPKNLDVKDRLIAKWMVDTLTKQPGISYQGLYQVLQGKLKLVKSFKEELTFSIHQLCIDWATTLLPHTTLLQNSSSEKIRELRTWINKHIKDLSKNLDEQIQDIKTAALSSKLSISLYDLEILAWSCMKETRLALVTSPTYDELAEEAKSHLIHHPHEHWKTAIKQATHFLMKAHEISMLGTKAEWNHRIELWSVQGELVLRSLELPETPLLHFVREMHSKNRSFADVSITTQLREQYLYRYPSPLIEPSRVHQIADLMRRYGWYHLASTPLDITFHRWLMLNEDLSLENLQAKTQREFPLFPPSQGLRKTNNKPIKINGMDSH